MDFISKIIQDYADKHTAAEPEILYELNRYTHLNVLKPRMLSGHFQGRFLSFISKLKQPKYILDIGTYTGYSALALAEGLRKDGILFTLDNNEELQAISNKFFQQSNYNLQIKPVLGDAIESINALNKAIDAWDLIWIDADKSQYLDYYKLCIDKLSVGGIMLIDNVLWSGKVAIESDVNNDKDTKSLHEFNMFIQADTRVENILLPIRDGIMMLIKI